MSHSSFQQNCLEKIACTSVSRFARLATILLPRVFQVSKKVQEIEIKLVGIEDILSLPTHLQEENGKN